ncbi:Mo-dependent nitrogenase C-terminal domain-containing protein [Thermocoleostomius sinensis]|jgi:hypothetical protein|uniref:Mo-dependent nitrogenase C-terminal domain-containing protein n=1 Tax=Thermocoleostomius sinensis A174 TaxID=2016057 RepID=A0A9E8ZBJ0_9CYAN|nr:Mo-dependent nitrogenase C-terminal domain-containing protein [Thermocoleostomius sinensis]WAL59797.1 Mo-dependent nitrogenase C-terminal domain-containing protein [Thermocoleostomius sinensis A174]
MNACNTKPENLLLAPWIWLEPSHGDLSAIDVSTPTQPSKQRFAIDVFRPLRVWLDSIQINNPKLAHQICQLVPAQCPFERDLKVFGHVLAHVPPMCKLNPVYDQVVALRFRALCYLADECGEDITSYC